MMTFAVVAICAACLIAAIAWRAHAEEMARLREEVRVLRMESATARPHVCPDAPLVETAARHPIATLVVASVVIAACALMATKPRPAYRLRRRQR